MDKVRILTETLLELRLSAQSIKSEEDLKEMMQRYKMLIVGSGMNFIFARELHSYLDQKFEEYVPRDEFLKIIPSVCKDLGMTLDPYSDAGDETREIRDYLIKLW